MVHLRRRSLRVLLLEDHDLVATIITLVMKQAGHQIVGPFDDVCGAMASPVDYDAAVLDINLPDGPSFRFATHLQECELPFVFYTGGEPHDMPRALDAVPIFSKHQTAGALLAVLEPLAFARPPPPMLVLSPCLGHSPSTI